MKIALAKLSHYGFNRRELTENDLLEICARENITVYFLDVPTSFYFTIKSKCFIVLKKSLRGLRRAFALAHELAHHFLHGGRHTAGNAFFFGLLESKNEVEADALALVALIPITSLSNFEFLENHPNRFASRLYKERQKLYFLQGI